MPPFFSMEMRSTYFGALADKRPMRAAKKSIIMLKPLVCIRTANYSCVDFVRFRDSEVPERCSVRFSFVFVEARIPGIAMKIFLKLG